ncbi:MAG: hypothetical protein WCJ35_02730 [Planctomycetota bacterium]
MWLLAEVGGGVIFAGTFCLLIALVMGAFVNAVVLRLACWIYNMQVGGWYTPRSVSLPSWGKATLICLVSSVVQFAIGLMWQVVWTTEQLSPITANLISTPLTFVLGVLMLYSMLPTTFLRALALSLIQYVILATIGMIMFIGFGGLELPSH